MPNLDYTNRILGVVAALIGGRIMVHMILTVNMLEILL